MTTFLILRHICNILTFHITNSKDRSQIWSRRNGSKCWHSFTAVVPKLFRSRPKREKWDVGRSRFELVDWLFSHLFSNLYNFLKVSLISSWNYWKSLNTFFIHENVCFCVLQYGSSQAVSSWLDFSNFYRPTKRNKKHKSSMSWIDHASWCFRN